MPGLVPEVLLAMFDALDVDPSIDALILARRDLEHDARRQVLPMALRVARAAAAAQIAVENGDRSLQSLLDALAWSSVPASQWLLLDPDASTLLDIDTRADMDPLRSGKGREGR